jgi:hypothetical protein
VDVHGAREQQRVTEVQSVGGGVADAGDMAIGDRQTGAGKGSFWRQDAAGDVLDK